MVLPNKEPWSAWDFPLRVTAGRVNGVNAFSQFGNNQNIDTTLEDIWDVGGVLQFLSSEETMDIVSTSTDDNGNLGGTGLHALFIGGLDNNYTAVSEVVILDGTTIVTTLQSFFRINIMFALAAGSNGTNVGNISATSSISSTIQAEIQAENGTITNSQLTVPKDKILFITSASFGTESKDEVEVNVQIREENGPWVIVYRMNLVAGGFQQLLTNPPGIFSKTDLRIQARNLGTGPGISVTSFMEFFLVDENLVNDQFIFAGF